MYNLPCVKFPRFNRHTLPNFWAALCRFFRPSVEAKFVSPDNQMRRVAVCRACPMFFAETRQCGHCSCFVDVKSMLTTERCPLGLWEHVDDPPQESAFVQLYRRAKLFVYDLAGKLISTPL